VSPVEYLAIPYVLVVESVEGPDGQWFRRAMYPELGIDGEALSLGARGGLALAGGLAFEGAPAVLVKRLAAARYLGQLGGPALPVVQCVRERVSGVR